MGREGRGEGDADEGGHVGSQLGHWLLLKQKGMQMMAPPGGKPGGQLPAVCVGPLQLHRGDGGVSQKLVAR